MTRKQWFWRILFYICGNIVLAMGIMLCTKTQLGVACVSSIPQSISNASGTAFAVINFFVYLLTVLIQFIIRGKQRRWRDILQIPYSLAFSACLGWFSALFDIHYELLWQKLLLMVVAILMLGVGMFFVIAMNFLPNPPDGMVQAFAEKFDRSVGLMKNYVDIVCVTISVSIDLIFTGKVTSIGIGTLCCMIFVGRTIALTELVCGKKVYAMSGQAPRNRKKQTVEKSEKI